MSFIEDRDKLLIAWQEAEKQLEFFKAKEMELRKACVALLGDPNKKKGTENIELGNGYKAKIVKTERFGFIKGSDNKTNREAIEQALQKIEAYGPAGELIAERLVAWKPELSVSEYNKLPDDMKAIIDEVLITSEGSPTFEIIEPKVK